MTPGCPTWRGGWTPQAAGGRTVKYRPAPLDLLTAAQWPRTRHGVFLVFLTTTAAGENAAPDAATAAAISDEMQQGQLDP